eukprot:jgi/Mesvir1/23174/Mv22646-RA.1
MASLTVTGLFLPRLVGYGKLNKSFPPRERRRLHTRPAFPACQFDSFSPPEGRVRHSGLQTNDASSIRRRNVLLLAAALGLSSMPADPADAGNLQLDLSVLANAKNEYWILRHGQSLANDAHLIVSDPVNGVDLKYGLAPLGYQQAAASGKKFAEEVKGRDCVHIYHSPFSRTTQTAQAVRDALGWGPDDSRFHVADALKERYFGPDLELRNDSQYKAVWASDKIDPTMTPALGAESVYQVVQRLLGLLKMLERRHEGCTILLVSHGDCLQIIQAMRRATMVTSQTEDSVGILRKQLVSRELANHKEMYINRGELRRL